eukprot:482459-Pelagomonas_calceolata.AAC.1
MPIKSSQAQDPEYLAVNTSHFNHGGSQLSCQGGLCIGVVPGDSLKHALRSPYQEDSWTPALQSCSVKEAGTGRPVCGAMWWGEMACISMPPLILASQTLIVT